MTSAPQPPGEGTPTGPRIEVHPTPPIADEEFRLLADFLYRHVGIHLKPSKHALLRSRLRKRLELLGLDSWGAYYAYLQGNLGEVPRFLDALTTNETFFMREEEHWEFLRDTIVPQAVATKQGFRREFAVWSAAASSGEELYSAAMILLEHLPLPATWSLRLVGSDINSEVLAHAAAGCYGEYAVRTLSPRLLSRYFSSGAVGKADGWQLSPRVKQHCRFLRHNLLEPFAETGFDLVLCRNVFIYFDKRAKQRALGHLIPATAVGGYLVFSLSEAMVPSSPQLERVRPSVYRRLY